MELCNGHSAFKIRSSAQGNCSAKSLAPSCYLWGGGLAAGGFGQGVGGGGGGRGHFHPPAIYCTTTWCFALNGLRTNMDCLKSITFDGQSGSKLACNQISEYFKDWKNFSHFLRFFTGLGSTESRIGHFLMLCTRRFPLLMRAAC